VVDRRSGSGIRSATGLHLSPQLLGDATDAWHLLQAKAAGVRALVAAHSSPLVTRARELEEQVGLRVFRPADYLSRWSTQQRLPG